MKIDSYQITGMLFPAILGSIPFLIFYFFLVKPLTGNFFDLVLAIKWVSDLGFSAAVIYLSGHIGRVISKELIEKELFSNGLRMPTTDYLLHSNSYFSSEYKSAIHQKILSDFGIKIPDRQEEQKNELESRKKIIEAVSLVRAKVGRGSLTGQHSDEYGFIRNLAGCSVVAMIFSVVNLIIFSGIYSNKIALALSFSTVAIY